MRKIVFDIETKNIFEDTGSSDPASLDLSVVGIYDSLTDTFSTYLEEELPALWPIIEKTDLLIGFNSDHFDIPLLNKYYPGDLTKIKSVDILKEVKNSLGRRLKLDTIAEATLGRNKTGNGLEALVWWRNGDIKQVRKYCLEDVRITRDIYEYARQNKHLKYKDNGKVREIPINPTLWEESTERAMTHTLPF